MNPLSHDKTEALRWSDRATQRDHRAKIEAVCDRIEQEVRVEVEIMMYLRCGFDDTRPGLILRLASLGFDEVIVLAALDRMVRDGSVKDERGHLDAGTWDRPR